MEAEAVEQFMRGFFLERTEIVREELIQQQPHRRLYYHPDCDWCSGWGTVELSEGERIEKIEASERAARVITSGSHPNHRSRFHLDRLEEGWRIVRVDNECLCCRFSEPSAACMTCSGTAWGTREAEERLRNDFEPKIAARPEGIPGLNLLDRELEIFMNEYVVARTALARGEQKRYEIHARSFYGPEFDWRRFVLGAEWSAAESVLGMRALDDGVHVFTREFHKLRLRYHLRPEGPSWRIWHVDTECLLCLHNGPKPDCWWCRGTIWEHEERRKEF
jgi:hypothetical protein